MNATPEDPALLGKVQFNQRCVPAQLTGESSCSHSYGQLLFHILLAQLFLQLCGDEGKHPAERQSNFCWISFQLYPLPNPVNHTATENMYPATKKWFVCRRTEGLLLGFGCRNSLLSLC